MHTVHNYWNLQVKWNKKCHVIIMIKTDLLGFVVTMHSGFCEQYIKSRGLTALALRFPVCTSLHASWQQIPPEPILIPQICNDFVITVHNAEYKVRCSLPSIYKFQWFPCGDSHTYCSLDLVKFHSTIDSWDIVVIYDIIMHTAQ